MSNRKKIVYMVQVKDLSKKTDKTQNIDWDQIMPHKTQNTDICVS